MVLVAAPGLVAVLFGDMEPVVRDAVWGAATSTDRSLESVVQAIPLRSRGGVRSFAVALWEPDERGDVVLTVVARGDCVVEVLRRDVAPQHFSSQGLQPWHLASFRDVEAVRFRALTGSDGADRLRWLDGSELPLLTGIVACSHAAWIFDEQSVGLTLRAQGLVGVDDTEITLERAPERRRGRHGGAPESETAPPPVRLGPRPAVSAQPVRSVHRPARVRIGNAAPFELHVPVYIGRRPRGPRQMNADQVVLIEVPSPTKEVSASHLEIVQRQDQVLVTDLRSTNGTLVTLPGAPRIKLHQGGSIVLPPYSRIDIGDGNVIEILPGAD